MSDDEHEAICARLRAALPGMQLNNPEISQRIIREMREPGWPDAFELAREAATTPRGKIYDVQDGRGDGGAFFRAQLPGSWRHQIELGFDTQIAGGVWQPSMLIRHAAHTSRVLAQLNAGSQTGNELQTIADLFEQYPAQAVDYAADWVATFGARVGGPR
jgi:hypothetical protein